MTAYILIAAIGFSITCLQVGSSVLSRRVAAMWVFGSFFLAVSYFGEGIQGLTSFPIQLSSTPALLALVSSHPRQVPRIRHDAALLVLVSLALTSAIWSPTPASTATSALKLLFMLTAAAILRSRLSDRTLVELLFRLLLAICLVSLVAASASFAWEQGRLRGLMENANGLGLIAVFAFFLCDHSRRRSLWRLLLGIVVVLSGSRASFLAILVALPLLGEGRFWLRRALPLVGYLAILAAALVLALSSSPAGGDLGLDRKTNSRTEVWAQALGDFAAAPLAGHGWNSVRIPGSSYLQLLRDIGLVGFGAAAAILYRTRKRAMSAAPWCRALLAAGLVNCVFESWLFAGGSFIALVFWVINMSRPASTVCTSSAQPPRNRSETR
jgi:O-antigen ligase